MPADGAKIGVTGTPVPAARWRAGGLLGARDDMEESAMKMSARNHLSGTVAEVKKVMAQVAVDIDGGSRVIPGA